ncbi:MAG: hypothetical protein HDR30_05815 [Lachnospiraceae bacterium]|nr:hypothetical protein [Lachnospiraceae bacterium]
MNQDTEKNTSSPDEEILQKETETAGTPKKPFHINMHIVFLSAIAIIVIVCAYKLYIWNKGVTPDDDETEPTTNFDVEVLDTIFPLAPDKLEGHEDDGITTILFLGDDPLSLDKGDTGIAQRIAAKTGATVYDGSFTGTTIAAAHRAFNSVYWMDALSLSYLADGICSGDFSTISSYAPYSYDPDFIPTVEMLQDLDMNSVDIICILYDASDYINERPSDDPNDPYSIVAYTGALRTAITNFQETYPFIRIVVMSHMFCHSINEEGNFQNGDRADLGHGTISHYFIKELDVTNDCGVSCIDNFYGSINEDNYLDYMTDYIHLNDAGKELLAQRFVDCILPQKNQDNE